MVLNGANEAAVGAFLDGAIPFGDIAELVEDALQKVPQRGIYSIEDVREADRSRAPGARDHENETLKERIMSGILYFILAILVLSLIVFAHELGTT